MTRFGDFAPLCGHVPSYVLCNAFFRQLQDHSPSSLLGLSADHSSAPVGVNPECGIPRIHHDGSPGNAANIVVCILSFFLSIHLVRLATRRSAAVGRVQFRFFLGVYATTLLLKLLTSGSFIEQGSLSLVVLTAIQAGSVTALFWALLVNALTSLQLVDDDSFLSVFILYSISLAFFAVTTYIGLDVAFTFSGSFGPSNPPQALHSVPLFVLTTIWPAIAALGFVIIMFYIVISILRETRPILFYVVATLSFILALLAWFLLGRVICHGTGSRLDGSFLATLLETFSVWMLFKAWTSITEDNWEEYPYNGSTGGKLFRDHYR